jgi:hypothetical protein
MMKSEALLTVSARLCVKMEGSKGLRARESATVAIEDVTGAVLISTAKYGCNSAADERGIKEVPNFPIEITLAEAGKPRSECPELDMANYSVHLRGIK